jgi:hypothetical protein
MSADPVSTIVNMARQLVRAGSAVDHAAIDAAITAVRPVVESTSGHAFTGDEIETVRRELETLFVVQQGPALALINQTRPPEWYVGDRRRPGPFMARYLQKLEETGWPEQSVSELKDSTARVLQVLDDPERAGPWDWRGLVVGDVQSGKTAHYAGVVNRAADAGYRVIVILAGMHNILRLQSQKRLEQDFLGYGTDPSSRAPDGRRTAIGVGEINPRLIVDSLTIAIPKGDFSLRIANQANFAPLSQPCLLVVKKNSSVLRALNGWIRRLPDASRAAPLLVIDDEADQASVDTGDQPLLPNGTFDEDYDPKRINGEIRKLVNAFERSAYVAYTATPFANILMHDERRAQDYGADLFPSTFIVSLTPPDDYFGPVAVFGTNDESGEDGLPLIRHVDQTAEGWIPDRHDKTLKPKYDGEDVAPPSLEEAINAFILACATRAARGQNTDHNSMLVHVSRFVDVHAIVHRQVQHYLDTIRALISGNDRDTLNRLRALWESDFALATALIAPTIFGRQLQSVTWSQVQTRLADSTDKIQVIVANGSSPTDIDYDSYKETGRSLIAIGGDKLSRGLTLEGLTVSYFLRIARQYDSLLQMGRWFGYRRGFADLCRLYTTPDMEDWFRHVATANKELRSQFAHMQIIGATPKDYGLRVEDHSILNVTAPNKQRHARPRQSSYAGEGKIQTVLFRDPVILDQNAAVTDSFITSLGAGTPSPQRPGRKSNASGELWRKVRGATIADFLSNLTFPPENIEIDGGRLAAYINTQIAQSELTEWTVFLPSADGSQIAIGGRTLGSVQRSQRTDRAVDSRYIIRTALSPFDEAIDLTEDEFANALAETNAERTASGQQPTDRPSGPSIRAVRGRRPQNGLLIIYPLDPKVPTPPLETNRPAIAVVVSFPESSSVLKRLYLENTVLRRGEDT